MKKKFLSISLVVAMAIIASFNIIVNDQENRLEGISLANIEALAGPEVSVPTGNYYITDVTATSHKCHTGGPFSCDL